MFTDFHELPGDRASTRRSRDRRRPGPLQRCTVRGARSPERSRHQGKDLSQFWHAPPRGLSQGVLRLMKARRESSGCRCSRSSTCPVRFPASAPKERGQSEAIGRNLYEMAGLATPVIVTVIGEGGSGGALAVAVGDVDADAAVVDVFGDFARGVCVHPVEVGVAAPRKPPRRWASPHHD